MGAQRQSSIRLLAPASLVLFAVVFLIVIVASLGGGDDEPGTSSERPAAASERRGDRARDRTTTDPGQRGNPRFYTVKPGDNLAAIAETTGVPLEELRSLNPSLDPQGLVSGQRVRLRESGD
jgi:LysM repeat protein